MITDWIFDPLNFQIPPITADATDPTHWLALWTARAALRDAEIDLGLMDHSRVGAVVGNTLGGEYGRTLNLRLRWPFIERGLRRALAGPGALDPDTVERLVGHFRHECLDPVPRITEDTLVGAMSNTIAGRICNYFDLRGGGCHRFVGEAEWKMRSIHEEGVDESIRAKFAANTVDNREPCRNCWVRYACGGRCAREAKEATGKISEPDPARCDLMRHLTDLALKVYVRTEPYQRELRERANHA